MTSDPVMQQCDPAANLDTTFAFDTIVAFAVPLITHDIV
jgi:hypothetical protein